MLHLKKKKRYSFCDTGIMLEMFDPCHRGRKEYYYHTQIILHTFFSPSNMPKV